MGTCHCSYFQPTNQWWAYHLRQSTCEELLSNWSIYFSTVFHMIVWSKMNERLHNMTINVMYRPKEIKKKQQHLPIIYITLYHPIIPCYRVVIYNFLSRAVKWQHFPYLKRLQWLVKHYIRSKCILLKKNKPTWCLIVKPRLVLSI